MSAPELPSGERSALPGFDDLAQAFLKDAEGGLPDEPRGPDHLEGAAAPSDPAEEPTPSAPSEEGVDADPEVETADPEVETADLEADDAPIVELPDGRRLTLEEIERGVLRQDDYSRKTQQLALERQELEARAAQVNSIESQEVQTLRALVEQLQQDSAIAQPSPQEWETLRTTDPGEYAARIADHNMRQQRMAYAQQEIERRDAAERQTQAATERVRLMEAVPAFRTEAGEWNADLYRQVGEYVVGSGQMDPDLWSGLTDHRLITLCHKAMEHDRTTRKAPQVTQALAKKPRILRPGASQPGNPRAERQRAADQHLRENPNSIDAAAAAYLAMMENRRG